MHETLPISYRGQARSHMGFKGAGFLAALLLTLGLSACGPQGDTAPAEEADNVIASGLAPTTGYRQINTPNPADALDTHIFELDNGLQV